MIAHILKVKHYVAMDIHFLNLLVLYKLHLTNNKCCFLMICKAVAIDRSANHL